jgi:hypothetical protein
MSDELPTTTEGQRPCDWCGEPVVQPRMGRTRRYCQRSHRQRAYEARRLIELRQAAAGATLVSSL